MRDSIDRPFTVWVVGSFLGCFGLVVVAENVDVPLARPLDGTRVRLAMLIVPEPAPPQERLVMPEIDLEETWEGRPAAVAVRDIPEQARSSEQRPGRPAPSVDEAALAERASEAAVALIGTALDRGAVADLLGEGMPAGAQGQVFDQIERTLVVGADPGAMRMRGSGAEGSGGGFVTAIRGDGSETRERVGVQIVERVIRCGSPCVLFDPGMDPVCLGTPEIVAAVRARLPRIRACYAHVAGPRGVEGKVTASFHIDPSGAVGGLLIEENTSRDPDLAACVTRHLAGMRLNGSPDPTTPTYRFPFVFSAGP